MSTPAEPTPSSAYHARRVFDAVKTPITLLVLLGILAFGAWYGYKMVTKPDPVAPPTPCTTVSAKVLTAHEVTVKVLNGGTKRGLAREVATALRTKGFITRTSGNTDERIGQTIVRGARVDAPEVKLVASQLKNPKIEADQRVDGTVDVLVGNEFAGVTTTAPTAVPAPQGACVAATPTPTPTVSPTP